MTTRLGGGERGGGDPARRDWIARRPLFGELALAKKALQITNFSEGEDSNPRWTLRPTTVFETQGVLGGIPLWEWVCGPSNGVRCTDPRLSGLLRRRSSVRRGGDPAASTAARVARRDGPPIRRPGPGHADRRAVGVLYTASLRRPTTPGWGDGATAVAHVLDACRAALRGRAGRGVRRPLAIGQFRRCGENCAPSSPVDEPRQPPRPASTTATPE
jgi:hypothetical protein